MYQFICGLCVGIYIGTKYDMKPYITRIEKELDDLKKKEK